MISLLNREPALNHTRASWREQPLGPQGVLVTHLSSSFSWRQGRQYCVLLDTEQETIYKDRSLRAVRVPYRLVR